MKKIFTGQLMDKKENVICPVCNKEVNVRVGWIDPYNNDRYVHFECLSEKRKSEIGI